MISYARFFQRDCQIWANQITEVLTDEPGSLW